MQQLADAKILTAREKQMLNVLLEELKSQASKHHAAPNRTPASTVALIGEINSGGYNVPSRGPCRYCGRTLGDRATCDGCGAPTS